MNHKAFIDDTLTTTTFYQAIIECMMNAFALHKIILDDNGNPCDYEFVNVNPAFELMTRLKKEAIINSKITEVIPTIREDKVNWIEVYGAVALKGKSIVFDSYSEALERWYSVNAYSPSEGFFITVFTDISQLKKNEEDLREKNIALTISQERLQHMVDHESLTGLPNILSFYKDMDTYLTASPNTKLALLYIGSDNFKFINGSLGHSFGEKLIFAIGKRLNSLIQSNYPIYALGSDEFIVCLKNLDYEAEAEACAERIIQSFEIPFHIDDNTLHITANIGIALYPEHGTNSSELLKNADMSLHMSKEKGKNRFVFYHLDMRRGLDSQLIIEKHLHTAMENHEFNIHYQPQLDLQTNEICGLEALLRWNSPELGAVSPLDFIQIAEKTHLIIPIGKWVLRNACYFIKKLQIRRYNNLTVSVNVSVIQLLQEDFVETVLMQLTLIELEPKYLELEVTESILIESYAIIYEKLETLRACGIKIAMDDFGKGYSSLSELHNLPIDTLKIDKIFIDSILSHDANNCIADMIILLGRKMGLRVLAEGVETQVQKDYLVQNQCDAIQGYLFSKPISGEEILALLGNTSVKYHNLYGFIWKNEYSINNSSIDTQHKKLFEIGNHLSELVFSKEHMDNSKQIADILIELKNYTEYHFSLEEALMRTHGYVYLENHINEHKRLIEKVNKVFSEFNQYTLKDFNIYLIDVISVWITNHILKEDMKFGEFLSNRSV